VPWVSLGRNTNKFQIEVQIFALNLFEITESESHNMDKRTIDSSPEGVESFRCYFDLRFLVPIALEFGVKFETAHMYHIQDSFFEYDKLHSFLSNSLWLRQRTLVGGVSHSSLICNVSSSFLFAVSAAGRAVPQTTWRLNSVAHPKDGSAEETAATTLQAGLRLLPKALQQSVQAKLSKDCAEANFALGISKDRNVSTELTCEDYEAAGLSFLANEPLAAFHFYRTQFSCANGIILNVDNVVAPTHYSVASLVFNNKPQKADVQSKLSRLHVPGALTKIACMILAGYAQIYTPFFIAQIEATRKSVQFLIPVVLNASICKLPLLNIPPDAKFVTYSTFVRQICG